LLKARASDAIIRDKYVISEMPNIAIQIYHGKFEGLIRVEVEFDSEKEANEFVPLGWMGKEMTNLPIARDGKLLDLTSEKFEENLNKR